MKSTLLLFLTFILLSSCSLSKKVTPYRSLASSLDASKDSCLKRRIDFFKNNDSIKQLAKKLEVESEELFKNFLVEGLEGLTVKELVKVLSFYPAPFTIKFIPNRDAFKRTLDFLNIDYLDIELPPESPRSLFRRYGDSFSQMFGFTNEVLFRKLKKRAKSERQFSALKKFIEIYQNNGRFSLNEKKKNILNYMISPQFFKSGLVEGDLVKTFDYLESYYEILRRNPSPGNSDFLLALKNQVAISKSQTALEAFNLLVIKKVSNGNLNLRHSLEADPKLFKRVFEYLIKGDNFSQLSEKIVKSFLVRTRSFIEPQSKSEVIKIFINKTSDKRIKRSLLSELIEHHEIYDLNQDREFLDFINKNLKESFQTVEEFFDFHKYTSKRISPKHWFRVFQEKYLASVVRGEEGYKDFFELASNNQRKILKEYIYNFAFDNNIDSRQLKHLNKYFGDAGDNYAAILIKNKNIDEIPPKTVSFYQNNIEKILKSELKDLLEVNSVPKGFLTWGDFVDQLPERQKRGFVFELLNNESQKFETVSIISQLNPSAGVREGVLDYFKTGKGIQYINDEVRFSSVELSRMFEGERFLQFFPHTNRVLMSGLYDFSKFKLAILTGGKDSQVFVNKDWIRRELNSQNAENVFSSVIGFKPVVSHRNLAEELPFYTRNLDDENLERGIRGLIIQGHYEKNGHSILTNFFRRGESQVESDIPLLMNRINRSLFDGGLSKLSPFEKKLFISAWANFENNSSLIHRMRNSAVRAAGHVQSFWNLRVEIHNFPTMDTYNKFLDFYDQLGGLKRNVDLNNTFLTLKNEMEEVLGIKEGVNTSESLIERSLLSEDVKNNFISELEKAETPLEKLKAIINLREKLPFAYNGKTFESGLPYIEYYRIENSLSDLMLKETAKFIENVNLPENEFGVSRLIEKISIILKGVEQDDMVSRQIIQNYSALIKEVKLLGISYEQKTEIVLSLLKNVIDQVYFKISDQFIELDNSIFRLLNNRNDNPVRFVDDILRSKNIFMLSKVVDKLEYQNILNKNISHMLFNTRFTKPVEVFNPGETVGILRIDKNAMELSENEIGVFSSVPGETSALSGIITLGVGARLSHLQLLAKSLGIPNSKISSDYLELLKKYEGKWVRYKTHKDGSLVINLVNDNKNTNISKRSIEIPIPSHSVRDPISFAKVIDIDNKLIAGPKGIHLAKLFDNDSLKNNLSDGFILPFGFFNTYASKVGLLPWINLLKEVKLDNKMLISLISGKIKHIIEENRIPDELLNQVILEMRKFQNSSGHSDGFFFRSDTNIEDLPGFNGAGLNESVANVSLTKDAVAKALRQVWYSAFKEKSIYWRGLALGKETVTIAEPSIVVMPTIRAQSSGVIISRGGENWTSGNGSISSNWGIGSVVEAGRPVEEIKLRNGSILRYSYTVSSEKPVISKSGGLISEKVVPGRAVLTDDQIQKLNDLAVKVDQFLGNQPHGWDIEWAIDETGKIIILQARPNM